MKTIVIIDDDEQVLDSLTRDLYKRYREVDIETCVGAEEALELRMDMLGEGREVDLYICDQKMPGKPGIEFLTELKEMGDKAGRILLTAYADASVAITGIKNKCIDYYIEKPYDEELFRSVDNLIAKPKKGMISNLPKNIQKTLPLLPTPFYMFNLDRIAEKVNMVYQTIRPDKVFYAVKCNSLPKVLETMGIGCGYEVNNRGEYEKIEKFGVDDIINSSPISSAGDVAYLFKKGVRHFAIDSKSQVDNITANAPGSKVYVRIYTNNEGSRFELSNRLGIHPMDAAGLLKYARRKGLQPYGVTFHVGSQCPKPKNWEEGLYEASNLFRQVPELSMVNIGGGFPVQYLSDIPALEKIAGIINEKIDECFDTRPEIWVEPGRFLVGDSAFTGTSVLHVEHHEPISRAVVDISVFSGLIEILETGNGFQYLMETNHPGKERLYQIGGPTCAGTDIVADEIVLPTLRVNHKDPSKNTRIYLLNTGAYTLDYIGLEQTAGFNGSKTPYAYYMQDGVILE